MAEKISDVIVAGEHVFEYATDEFANAVRALAQKQSNTQEFISWNQNEINGIVYG